MNKSIVSPPHLVSLALAAVEGIKKNQTGTYKNFTYNASLRMKLSKNAGITEYNYAHTQLFYTANSRRKALQERATLFIFFCSCQSDPERRKRRNAERRKERE